MHLHNVPQRSSKIGLQHNLFKMFEWKYKKSYKCKKYCSPIFPLLFKFEIRQLRAHLAQQDLDLVAEREAAMQIHHIWGKQNNSFQEVDGLAPGASEQHGPAKNREPGGHTGNCLIYNCYL